MTEVDMNLNDSNSGVNGQSAAVAARETYTDFTIGDVLRYLRRSASWLMAGAVCGMLVGYAVWRMMAPIWFAEATIRMGKLPGGAAVALDQPLDMLARIKSPFFVSNVVQRLEKKGGAVDGYAQMASSYATGKISDIGTQITVTMPGASAQQAYDAAWAAADTLIAAQLQQLASYKEQLDVRVQDADKALVDVRRAIVRDAASSEARRGDEADRLFVLLGRVDQYSRFQGLQRKRDSLRDIQDAMDTASPLLVEEPVLPLTPKYPRRSTALILGLLGGLVVSMIMAGMYRKKR